MHWSELANFATHFWYTIKSKMVHHSFLRTVTKNGLVVLKPKKASPWVKHIGIGDSSECPRFLSKEYFVKCSTKVAKCKKQALFYLTDIWVHAPGPSGRSLSPRFCHHAKMKRTLTCSKSFKLAQHKRIFDKCTINESSLFYLYALISFCSLLEQ